ncbi:DUF554 domain-containing protein [Clostridium sp. ZS2-4]|uniref:DUF554 domain-containing protein n=1 Tax=Clostridium sp. ZS2-4 TaxID=2987703 RepID=UPI00227BC0F4|nr:DUF554 domain-containing protein [Clostridium sp. ZS2-4]MCY6354533.1 DUF554 domain-containing protein [Clostridium sp. ZS2-4]
MIGTIVNFFAIIVGSFIGILLKGGISEKVSKNIMNGLSLCVLFIGIINIIDTYDKLESNSILIIIISVVIGAVIGEMIDIQNRIDMLGKKIEEKFTKKSGGIAEGFVTCSLLFCIGAMAIVGSLESGLLGSHKTLFAKSVLDGITSIIFASSLGIGVMISAVSVFIYQGLITIGASFLKGILIGSVINNMTAIGGILIIGLAFNVLGITKIKVANLLPAIFLPVLYQCFMYMLY